MLQSSTIDAAVALFKEANSADPNRVVVNGSSRPRELVQAERLAAWVLKLEPQPSQALWLAAHCQHIRRWEVPRSSFPNGRVGYLKWRKHLSKFHADTARELLRSVGVDETTIEEVRAINLKQGLATNKDTQAIEDALCLAFLEHDFEAFAGEHDAAKVREILKKTWRKMSPRAREAAGRLSLAPELVSLIESALSSELGEPTP